MDLSRRRLLVLLAGSVGLGSLLTACRTAVESAASTTTPMPLIPAATSTTTTTSTRPAASPPPTLPAPESLEIIGREGWSSRPQGEFRYHRIKRITIHHTAAEIDDNRRAPALIRQHEDWHMSHGWPDLAYHFMVDRNGNVYEGRPIEAIGDTFTEYDPTGHFLACFEGHFDRQAPSGAQLAAMTRLVAWAMQTYSVSGDLIGGHRDWADTTCPGDNMYWRLAGLTRAASDHGAVALSYLRDDDARERVALITSGD
jgi:hypothetical protein